MHKFFASLMVIAALTGVFKLYREHLAVPHQLDLPLAVEYVQGPEIVDGKPVLVEAWATWCGPCRQSIPHLNELWQQYGPRGLQVVGITHEDRAVVQAFMKDVPMRYSVALDTDNHYHRQLGVSTIPHAFLLNAQHRIVWHGHPLELTPAEVEKVLAQ